MASTPFFSVLLCIHRDNPFFDEAVASVLQQTWREFEFIIGANACDDALWQKIEAIAAQDARVRVMRSEIGQLAYNLNRTADAARGTYLVRMDADDVCVPERLERMHAYIVAHAPDIVGSDVLWIDEQGRTLQYRKLPQDAHAIRRHLMLRSPFCHPAVAIRREFLIGLRGYLGGMVSEDVDLWLRAQRAGARMANIGEPLLRYRVHGAQVSRSPLGYAEVAGLWLREFLLTPSFYTAGGLCASVAKALLRKLALGWFRLRLRREPH